MSQRTDRVADLIRRELSLLLRTELRDPRAHLASINSVRVSADLRHADIQVSVLGTEAERLESVAALVHARGFLRRQLAHRLSLRMTPELKFHLDRGAEHSERIATLLDELSSKDSDDGA